MLGCELWMENFDSMLKEYIIDLWEVMKVKLYGEPCSTHQSLAGDLRDGNVVGEQRRGKLVSSVTQGE